MEYLGESALLGVKLPWLRCHLRLEVALACGVAVVPMTLLRGGGCQGQGMFWVTVVCRVWVYPTPEQLHHPILLLQLVWLKPPRAVSSTKCVSF